MVAGFVAHQAAAPLSAPPLFSGINFRSRVSDSGFERQEFGVQDGLRVPGSDSRVSEF